MKNGLSSDEIRTHDHSFNFLLFFHFAVFYYIAIFYITFFFFFFFIFSSIQPFVIYPTIHIIFLLNLLCSTLLFILSFIDFFCFVGPYISTLFFIIFDFYLPEHRWITPTHFKVPTRHTRLF